MAVPVARLCSNPGIVLHKPGGHVKPPSPPLCRGGPPPSVTYLRCWTGVSDTPVYPDLYFIPPDVAKAKQMAPGWYATLSAGDEFDVVFSAAATGAAARKQLFRSVPKPFTGLGVSLYVDGVATLNYVFDTADIVFRGWLVDIDDEEGTRVYNRFRMDRTVGSVAAAGGDTATADCCPELGRLSLTCQPFRRTGGKGRPRTSAPAAAPALTERDAIKNRSLAAGIGTSVKASNDSSEYADWGPALPAEEVTIYYRERRVLVAKGILLETGEVAPTYRQSTAGGGSRRAATDRALPLWPGAGVSPSGVVKAERQGGGAATVAPATDGSTSPMFAKAEVGGGTGRDAGRASGRGARKRKAVEIIILD